MKGLIFLGTIDRVKSFVTLASKFEGNIDIISGRYTIDGKSIMGLFSLDLSKEVTIVLHGDSKDAETGFIDILKENNFKFEEV